MAVEIGNIFTVRQVDFTPRISPQLELYSVIGICKNKKICSYKMTDLFKKTKDKHKEREEKAKHALREANREWVRKESEAMLARGIIEREKTKEKMFERRLEHDRTRQIAREARLKKWLMKTKSSPLAVNLVAEEDRVHEEMLIRTTEENSRKKTIQIEKVVLF